MDVLTLALPDGKSFSVDAHMWHANLTCEHESGMVITGVPSSFTWHSTKSARDVNTSYVATNYKGKTVRLHRLLLSAPSDLCVHHKDGNGYNNTLANITLCSVSENNHKRFLPIGKTGFIGVRITPQGKYAVRITKAGKTTFVGVFQTAIEAARAYDAKAIELFGEFARLNFPQQ